MHCTFRKLSRGPRFEAPAGEATRCPLCAEVLEESCPDSECGAPVTEAYAKQIGADGYSPDASSAARLAKTLVTA